MTEIPREIGKTEKDAFRERVIELVDPPDEDGWSATYVKGERDIFLKAPAKTHPKRDSRSIDVRVIEPLFDTDEGYKVKAEKSLSSVPILGPKYEFYYGEEELVFDRYDNLIPSSGPIETFRQMVNAADAATDEFLLGGHIVTPERYRDVMGVLNSLRPEDRIPPKNKRK